MIDQDFISNQLITYIGNKRKLVQFIGETISPILNDFKKPVLFDGFAGSGVVSRFVKRFADKIIVNDLEPYSAMISSCYMSNKSEVKLEVINDAIDFLNKHKTGIRGVISENYAPIDDNNIQQGERCFYTVQNAEIIDSIRTKIEQYPDDLKPYLLSPLLYRASVHVNTAGIFKGFYKDKYTGIGKFGGTGENALGRIKQEINLDRPVFSEFECDYEIHNSDINSILDDVVCDIAYYDPPYNQHPYGSNYFMLNTILDNRLGNDISTVSGIPSDWRKSQYNKKQSAILAFHDLISRTQAKYILVAYNDGGILSLNELKDIFEQYGTVEVKQKSYPRFRGSRPTTNKQSITVMETIFVIKLD